MIENLFSLFKFLFTNILFALILCSFLRWLDKEHTHSAVELLLVSLGLAPAVVTLLLYFSFLCFPPMPNPVYVLIVTVVYSSLFWLGRKELFKIYYDIKQRLFGKRNKLKKMGEKETRVVRFRNGREYKVERWLYSSLVLFLLIILAVSFLNVLDMPVSGYDALAYAAEGKALFKIKHIEFRNTMLDPETGMYLSSLHAPSFSLLLTWEKMLNSLFGLKSDMLFRSVAFYFGLLLLAGQYYCMRFKGKWLALLGTVCLLSCYSFYGAMTYIHIDTYRIYFIAVAWFYLAGALKTRDRFSYLLLGIASGLAAFAHTLGAVMAAITIFVFFIFLKGGFLYKIKITSIVFLFALAAGGIHYVIDTLWGRGWIFGIYL